VSNFVPKRLLYIAVLAALGCGGAGRSVGAEVGEPELIVDRTPRALEAHAHVIPGETMRFELSLRGIVGGEATLATGEPGTVEGREVVITRSRTETVGLVKAIKDVSDDVITHIDLATGVPVYHHADVKFGDREAVIESHFDGSRVAVSYHRKDHSERVYLLKLPDGQTLFDAHSMVASLRGWTPTIGERAYFYVVSGRRLWQNNVIAATREEVRTAMGQFHAVRIDGVARRLRRNLSVDPSKKARKYTVWISDDAQRRPLRVVGTTEYGEVKAELIEHYVPEKRLVQR